MFCLFDIILLANRFVVIIARFKFDVAIQFSCSFSLSIPQSIWKKWCWYLQCPLQMIAIGHVIKFVMWQICILKIRKLILITSAKVKMRSFSCNFHWSYFVEIPSSYSIYNLRNMKIISFTRKSWQVSSGWLSEWVPTHVSNTPLTTISISKCF